MFDDDDPSYRNRRVAVVVFVEVHDESADDRDAGHRAEAGLRAALAGDAALSYEHANGWDSHWTVAVQGNESKHVPCDVNMTVHGIEEVGVAAGNGYLWTQVTDKAFPHEPKH